MIDEMRWVKERVDLNPRDYVFVVATKLVVRARLKYLYRNPCTSLGQPSGNHPQPPTQRPFHSA